MKKLLLTALAAASVTSASAAVYVDVSAGTNAVYSAANELTGEMGGYGWNASLGYQFNEFVSAEIGMMQNSMRLNFKDHLNVPFLAARFDVPVSEDFSFITKIGVMEVMHKDDNARLPYVGIGAAYHINDDVDATLMYQGAVYGVAGVGLLGVGIHYKM